ncbi:hypothetical protein QO259_05725 [Salinicola sp. JS01]|uniref:hypothetical protein n=1 Tax=Salinicola sp. JS01 TaxID=3050071 RepID=UPI00255BB251|nr:hypothetical protein [Salinicola sp. JS01]WIX34162.1 hypothetical protein QO259_05725 [Salinicola sp. JS01]
MLIYVLFAELAPRAIGDHSPRLISLNNESLEPWLDPHFTEREAPGGVTRHINTGLIQHWAVSTAVNKPSDDHNAALINPL